MIACSDSRVDPSIIFDAEPGEGARTKGPRARNQVVDWGSIFRRQIGVAPVREPREQ